MRRCAILVLVLAGSRMLAAQNPPAQSTESRPTPAPAMSVSALSALIGGGASVTEEDTSGSLPQIPSMLGGQGTSLALLAEQERSNYLRGGINIGTSFDDNASLASSGAVSNTIYSVFPNIAIKQTFSRLRWNLGYAAGMTVNQKLSNRNQASQALKFDSQFRLSPHVNLRVAEDFSLSSGFFDSAARAGFVGGGSPNANLIAPLSRQRSSSTVAAVDYHFALKDMVGASGSFSDLHFSDLAPSAILANTRTTSGSAFWLHGLFGRDWIGASYRFQRLTFEPGTGKTMVHSLLCINTFSLPGRFTLTGFVGPEYSDNRGLTSGSVAQVAHFTQTSVAGGADIGWQKEHTTLAAGFSRHIQDGGGVLGAVRLQSVHGDIRQELFPGWAAGLSVSYGKNKALTVPVSSSASSVDAATLGALLERNLGRNIGLSLGYSHEFQDRSGITDPAFSGGAHRNRFSVTIGYQWVRLLGR